MSLRESLQCLREEKNFFLGPSPKSVTPGDNKYRVTGSVEAAGLDLKRSTWTPRYFEGYGAVEGEQRGSLQG